MTPVRVQRRREKGWRMPENTVYVGRPSQWGNPWPVDGEMQPWLALALGFRGDEAGRRASAVRAFAWWIAGDDSAFPVPTDAELPNDGGEIEYTDGSVRKIRSMLARSPIALPVPPDLAPLRGRNLACYCDLTEPCHADVLLELANR